MNGTSYSKFNFSRIKSNLNVHRFHIVRVVLRTTEKYKRLQLSLVKSVVFYCLQSNFAVPNLTFLFFSSKRDEEAIKLTEEAIELSKKNSKTKAASKTKLKKKSSSTVAKKKSSPYLIRTRSQSAPPKERVIVCWFYELTGRIFIISVKLQKCFRNSVHSNKVSLT